MNKLLFIGITLLPLSAIANENTDGAQNIVVDIPPIALALENIKANNPDANFHVTVLLPENTDAHHFALKPSQAEALENADYIFGIGTNFMPDYVKAAKNLSAKDAHTAFYYDDYIEAEKSTAPIREGDAHYWLSPEHMNQITAFFAEELGLEAPSDPIETPQAEGAESALITSHDAFGYFEDATGYQSQATLHDAQGQAIPPRQMATIEKQIKNGEIQCLLMESGEHSHAVEDFAHDENLRIEAFDLLGWQVLNNQAGINSYYESLAQIYKNCQD